MSSLKYRSDIDGLRAIAVLSVVIFHINKNWLPGGFIGVDIFFVISGFLITKIIYKEITEGQFSFLNFYKRRMKRILPVFFIVILSTVIIASLVMLPSDFLHFMKSVGSTLIFSSNMFFGYAVDYFSPNTEEYPLLHTWSLAVEEQYYIVFPVVLLLFCKILRERKNILFILFMVCFFSIMISCLLPYYPSWIKYNYYWLPSRAYELMVGSIAAIATMDKKSFHESSWSMSVSGMLMIILSLMFIKESNEFPGMLAIIPCIGTALILSSGGREANLVNKLLSLRFVVFIGLISYSLYLWHWPVLAIMRYISNDGELSIIQMIIASCLMLFLSFLSWKFIEIPVRKSNIGFIKAVLVYYFLPSTILGFLVYGAVITDGYPQRYGSKNDQMKQETTYMVTPFCHNVEIGNCVFGDLTKNPDTYMVGDSHAGHYSPMMDEIGKKEGFSFVAKTVDACYPLLDVNGQYPSKKEPFYTDLCPKLIKEASVEYKKYKNIIFAGVWSEHFRLNPEMQMWLENQISTLTNEGHNVFIIEQVPMFKPATYDHAFRQRFSIVNISKITGNSSDMREFRVDVDRATNQLLKEITLKYKNVYFIEPMTSLGKAQNRKLPFFNGHLVYRDNGHLNEYGSRMIGNYVADKITAIKVINSNN